MNASSLCGKCYTRSSGRYCVSCGEPMPGNPGTTLLAYIQRHIEVLEKKHDRLRLHLKVCGDHRGQASDKMRRTIYQWRSWERYLLAVFLDEDQTINQRRTNGNESQSQT